MCAKRARSHATDVHAGLQRNEDRVPLEHGEIARVHNVGKSHQVDPPGAPKELRIEPDRVLLCLLQPASSIDVALHGLCQAGQDDRACQSSADRDVAAKCRDHGAPPEPLGPWPHRG